MANRILIGSLGNGSNPDKGIFISQPGDNVLSPSEPLLFDSTSKRSGMQYAGGNASSTTTIEWSSVKGTLGYIPIAISMDNRTGFEALDDGTDLIAEDRTAAHKITTTHISPVKEGDGSGRTATNFKFVILRIPCQYGKMTDSSLWT